MFLFRGCLQHDSVCNRRGQRCNRRIHQAPGGHLSHLQPLGCLRVSRTKSPRTLGPALSLTEPVPADSSSQHISQGVHPSQVQSPDPSGLEGRSRNRKQRLLSARSIRSSRADLRAEGELKVCHVVISWAHVTFYKPT